MSLTTTLPRCKRTCTSLPRRVLETSLLLSKPTPTRGICTSSRPPPFHGQGGTLTLALGHAGGSESVRRVAGRRYSSTRTSAKLAPSPPRTPTPSRTREQDEVDAEREATSKPSRTRLKSDLRTLLREIAQPVAVVTSFMPGSTPSSSSSSSLHAPDETQTQNIYHGATLSSFTSIAMDPYPLVSFALRIPSRMADALSGLVVGESELGSSSSPLSTSPPSSSSSGRAMGRANRIATSNPTAAHMVINLLSSAQASTALMFSRPDLYPTPFLGSSSSSSPSSSPSPSAPSSPRTSKNTNTPPIPYTLSPEGLPILHGALGALSCRLVGRPIPLHDLAYLESLGRTNTDIDGDGERVRGTSTGTRPSEPEVPALGLREGEVASELFIARVVRVEEVRRRERVLGKQGEPREPREGEEQEEWDGEQEGERTLQPLIYYQRGYTTCKTGS